VTVTIDDAPRPTVDIEAHKAARASARADTLTVTASQRRRGAAVADEEAQRAA